MGKRLLYTPNSKIKAALRKLWLYSRERQSALKRDNYTCVKCGKKQSRSKGNEVFVEVHHREGILNWGKLFKAVRLYLLCSPEKMETNCVDCHKRKDLRNEKNYTRRI